MLARLTVNCACSTLRHSASSTVSAHLTHRCVHGQESFHSCGHLLTPAPIHQSLECCTQLNEQDFRKNLEFFKVPQAGIEAVGNSWIKISYKDIAQIFDEYTNIHSERHLSTRFNERPADRDASMQPHSVPPAPTSPFITSLAA